MSAQKSSSLVVGLDSSFRRNDGHLGLWILRRDCPDRPAPAVDGPLWGTPGYLQLRVAKGKGRTNGDQGPDSRGPLAGNIPGTPVRHDFPRLVPALARFNLRPLLDPPRSRAGSREPRRLPPRSRRMTDALRGARHSWLQRTDLSCVARCGLSWSATSFLKVVCILCPFLSHRCSRWSR